MPALSENYLSILKTKLENDFIPHLPELLDKKRPKIDQDKKQLSRAFSGFVFHKMLDIGVVDAAKSVVDDFDDNGLDAIYYKTKNKTLYLLQTKFREGAQFDETDAIKFRHGVDLLLAQRYDNFNVNVQNRRDELNTVFYDADHIQLVVAYIGTGFSAHAKAALQDLTENKDHHEIGRLQAKVEEYCAENVQADLLAEKSVGVVNDDLQLSKWQHIGGHRETHIGVALVSDLVALYKKHGKALYERNIRYYLGSRESKVNQSIQDTLATAPNEFFYRNNGITALADQVEVKGRLAKKRLQLRGLSVINGAQTISSAAEYITKNPNHDISAATVLVTIIKADSEGEFGRSVTRARNHQNPVTTGNFASLDPAQEKLRREVAHIGWTYFYRPEASPKNIDSSKNEITIEQALKALPLFLSDSRYPYWLKNDNAQFQNKSSQYKHLFTDVLTGSELVNKVNFYKFVSDTLNSSATCGGAEGLFYRHGAYLVASVLAKKCLSLVKYSEVISPQLLFETLSLHLDDCRQACWDIAKPLVGQGRAVLAYFQNQDKTIRLLGSCMTSIYGLEQDAVLLTIKGQANKSEAFPQEKLFRYLTSRAPEIARK